MSLRNDFGMRIRLIWEKSRTPAEWSAPRVIRLRRNYLAVYFVSISIQEPTVNATLAQYSGSSRTSLP